MKTITLEQIEIIKAFEFESSLPTSVLEKDILITEILKELTKIKSIEIFFCGGTSLSKGYQLINRMSEDIDFKFFIPTNIASKTKKKQYRSQVKKELITIFNKMDFITKNTARDENKYLLFELEYESRFPMSVSLRPEIKVELTENTLLLSSTERPIQSFISMFLGRKPSFYFPCVTIQETILEKVLSFLRRIMVREMGYQRRDFDERLIRHVYDVAIIQHQQPSLIEELPIEIFQTLVNQDAEQFKHQYPEFYESPKRELKKGLVVFSERDEFQKYYEQFLQDLVLEESIYPFKKARDDFIRIANILIETLSFN